MVFKAGQECRTSQPLYSYVLTSPMLEWGSQNAYEIWRSCTSVTVISISVQHDHSTFGSVSKFRHLRHWARQTILQYATCNIW